MEYGVEQMSSWLIKEVVYVERLEVFDTMRAILYLRGAPTIDFEGLRQQCQW